MQVGTGRTVITPAYGVELGGYGFYLQRRWDRLRDDLHATAVVFDDGSQRVAVVALDVHSVDAAFTSRVREAAAAATAIPDENILVACTHTHNAPICGPIEGTGRIDPVYVAQAAAQAATAIAEAWQSRQPATLRAGSVDLPGLTVGSSGASDARLTVLRADGDDGEPFAILVNYAAPATILVRLGWNNVSRDFPGQVVDTLQAVFRGATVAFLQGSCGDVNFTRRFADPSAARDGSPGVMNAACREPGRAIMAAAVDALTRSEAMDAPTIAVSAGRAVLPTRRWTAEEVNADLEEGRKRLESGSVVGWRESLAPLVQGHPERVVEGRYQGSVARAVQALARFAVTWAERIQPDLATREETVEAEVQAIRIGTTCMAAHPAGQFSRAALALREKWGGDALMLVGHANGHIGDVPDAEAVAAGSYAALQAPKALNQFPFTGRTGSELVDALLTLLGEVKAE